MLKILLVVLLTSLSWMSFSQSKRLKYVKNKSDYKVIYGKDLGTGTKFCDTCKYAEGRYKDGVRDGKWIKYHPNGKPKLVANYRDNRPYGSYQKFYESGKLQEQGTFKRMRFSGVRERYYESGCKQFVVHYNEKGQEHGDCTYYSDNCKSNSGNGQMEISYLAVNGVPQNIQRKSQDGDSEGIFSVTHTSSGGGKYNGGSGAKNSQAKSVNYRKIYNRANELWKEGEFRNGRLWNGKLYLYDEEGILLDVHVYKKGKFYSKGQL